MDYEILLKNATFKDTLRYITEHAAKVYYVEPGFKVFDRRLIGVPPVPVGVGPAYIMLTVREAVPRVFCFEASPRRGRTSANRGRGQKVQPQA